MTDSFLDDLGRRLDEADVALRAASAAPAPAPATGGPHRRRTRGRRAAVAVAALAALAGLVALTGGRPGAADLSARAYAATTGPGIIHWRTEIAGSVEGRVSSRQRTEGWTRNGVTHELRYDVVHGTGVLQSESRTAGGRTTTWLRAEHDYIRGRAGARHGTDPFRSGDPLAIFRRAYRAGKLTKVGPTRYGIDLPGRSDDAHRHDPLTYYDIDPDSALPVRFVVRSPAQPAVAGHPEARRPASQTVMTFSVYETLPSNPTTRKLLRLLPHRPGGPRQIAAAERFAVLRTGAVPGPEAAKTIARMARSMLGGRLDAAGARSLADGTYLLPGRDHLCLVTIDARGSGGACQATEEAIKRGLSSTSPGRFVHVVVPDGVAALRARLRGGRTLRVAVRGNLARLPAAAYAWRFAP